MHLRLNRRFPEVTSNNVLVCAPTKLVDEQFTTFENLLVLVERHLCQRQTDYYCRICLSSNLKSLFLKIFYRFADLNAIFMNCTSKRVKSRKLCAVFKLILVFPYVFGQL